MKNVEIKLPNGTVEAVELISYFQVLDNGKKYLFYTKNEIVENNLIKMYVTEINSDNNVINGKIPDEEWTKLKNIMKSILIGGNNDNIKYLEIGEG